MVCVFIVQTLQKSGDDSYPTVSISGNLSDWTAGILSSDICMRKRSGPPFALSQVWTPGSAGIMGLEQFIHSELYLFSSLVNFTPPACTHETTCIPFSFWGSEDDELLDFCEDNRFLLAKSLAV